MAHTKYEGWMKAPIDNKNIMEDYADDVRIVCERGHDKETFWRDGALFVVDNNFGSNIAYVRYVYGKKSEAIAQSIKEELEAMFAEADKANSTVCEVTVDGYDVRLAFFFKPEEELDKDAEPRDVVVLEALEKLENGLDFDDTSVKVPLLDEYHEKYGERYATLCHAFAYYGEIRVEGDHYEIDNDFNIADLPGASQNELYKAIFKALESQNDETNKNHEKMENSHENQRKNAIFRSELHDLDDVKAFFHDLVFVLYVSIYPDEDFKNYTNLKTKERSFTDIEASALNKCMELCFKICGRRSDDLIYRLALEATEEFYNKVQQSTQK